MTTQKQPTFCQTYLSKLGSDNIGRKNYQKDGVDVTLTLDKQTKKVLRRYEYRFSDGSVKCWEIDESMNLIPVVKVKKNAPDVTTPISSLSSSDNKDQVKHEMVEVKPSQQTACPKYTFRNGFFGNDNILEWTLEDFKKLRGKYPYLCEYLGTCQSRVVPFVDFDMTWDSKDQLPDEHTQKAIFDFTTTTFKSLCLNEDIEVISAYRKAGFASKVQKTIEVGKWKVSLRLWMRGVHTTMEKLKSLLHGYIPDMTSAPDIMKEYNFGKSFFDVSVYEKNRKMSFVGARKSPKDPRVLERWECDAPLEDFIIQRVLDTDQEVKWRSIEKFTAKSVSSPKKQTKVVCSGNSDIVLDGILSLFPDEYFRRDLAEPKEGDHAMTVFVKSNHCLIAQGVHTESVNKMYFVVTRRNIIYKCSNCGDEIVKHHDNSKLKAFFTKKEKTRSGNIKDDLELLSKKIDLVKRGTQLSIAEYYQLVGQKMMWSQELDLVAILNSNNVWELADRPGKTAFALVLHKTVKGDIEESDLLNEMIRRDTGEILLKADEMYKEPHNEDDKAAFIESEVKESQRLNHKAIKNVIQQLETEHPSECIANFIKKKNRQHSMLDLFISRPELLAFEDGVYNLHTNTFQVGIKPTDYVFMTTGYNFPQGEVDYQTEMEIDAFLNSIFENREMKEFDLDLTAQAMYGRRVQEIMTVEYGSGRGGKGTKACLTNSVFGDYFYEMEPETLCEPISCTKPKPDLWNLRGKRYITSSEPQENSTFCSATLKKLTGGDRIDVRTLHGKPASFRITGLLNMQTNSCLKTDVFKVAENERIYYKSCPFTYTDTPQSENERKIDRTLKGKFQTPLYRDTFLLMLLKRWKDQLSSNMNIAIPPSVLEFTRAIQAETNIKCGTWFYKHFVILRNATVPVDDRLSSESIYLMWKGDEHVTSEEKRSYPSIKKFITDLRLLGGIDAKVNGVKRWQNIETKTYQQEDGREEE
ncbi:hypothetical protein BC832DRAFT_591263 [Gaertneriomyces semiglobifer]|nr:hypothetical protein BC832DRAFT_591263 [Gaertneriomyces semiglobifer]